MRLAVPTSLRAGFLFLASAHIPIRLFAQAAALSTLSPANATTIHEFSSVTSVRELADKHVLVTDAVENRIFLIDFEGKKATALGRPGTGPGEFRHVTPLMALGLDSSIMVNTLVKEWIVFRGETGPIRPASGSPLPASVLSLPRTSLVGFDQSGHILLVQSPPISPSGLPLNAKDSVYILIVSTVAQATHVDTVGRLKIAMIDAKTVRKFTAWEEAALSSDGWLAVLRLNPYRIDWRSPNGAWIKGPPIEVSGPGLPPFQPRPDDRLTTFDDKLLVMRSRDKSTDTVVYDVFNHRGERERQVKMNTGEQIIGFGIGSAYVALTDKDNTVHLLRVPWP